MLQYVEVGTRNSLLAMSKRKVAHVSHKYARSIYGSARRHALTVGPSRAASYHAGVSSRKQ